MSGVCGLYLGLTYNSVINVVTTLHVSGRTRCLANLFVGQGELKGFSTSCETESLGACTYHHAFLAMNKSGVIIVMRFQLILFFSHLRVQVCPTTGPQAIPT